MDILESILFHSWEILLDLSPYLILGFFLSGIVYVLIPRAGIHKAFGKPGFFSVLRASLFGIPLPLCSCSVIPAAVSMREQGASRGSTLGFLITTPETGIDSISVSAVLLDPLLTIFRPLAALVTGMIAGVAEDTFDPTPNPPRDPKADLCKICPKDAVVETAHEHSVLEKLGRALRYAFVDLFGDIVWWLLLGLLISGVIGAFLEPGTIAGYVENQWLQMFAMLLVGVPVYICASASTPIAASLIIAGISPGAALVFLLVGPATNVATLLVVWLNLGKRATFVYLGSIIVVSLGLGFLLNRLYDFMNLDPQATIGAAGELLPGVVEIPATVLFLFLISWILVKKFRK